MNTVPSYTIIKGTPAWADAYRAFCCRVYKVIYPRPELGITQDLFSEDVFNESRVVDYFKERFSNHDGCVSWLAITKDQQILGGITARKHPTYCELLAFYVEPVLQGHGIGHALYQRALAYVRGLPIQVDVVNYMHDTIAMYTHWGFKIDESKGKVIYPWRSWSEEARQAWHGIYMTKPADQ